MTLWILTVNSWREQVRARFFSVMVIFAAFTLYVSTLLGMLAQDQEIRVLLDFGLAFIEVVSALAVAYAAATGLLQEIETKTLYLVLTRPVSRSAYLLGRFFGLLASSLAAIGLMGLFHVCVLMAKGWHGEWSYALALLGVGLKIVLTASLAGLLALISTSVLSALCMTGICWTLGHFVSELRYLSSQSPGILGKILGFLVYLVPNLQLFNFRDRLDVPSASAHLPYALGYCAFYAAACLAVSLALFRRKEF